MGTNAHAVAPVLPAEGTRTSKKAIASLVLGIIGLVLIPLISSAAALGLGISARREISREPGVAGGGLAVAGIVLGAVGLILWLVGVVAILALRIS